MEKLAKLSAISPAVSSCMSYTLFVEIPRHLEIPPIDFYETSLNRRQAPKEMPIRGAIRFRAKTIVALLLFRSRKK